MAFFLGWDIGGAHLKASLLETGGARARLRTAIVPFEIWRQPQALQARLAALRPAPAACAVTMTAELSDVFSDRAQGVRAILDACRAALAGEPFRVLDCDGGLIRPEEASESPSRIAAANWMATARLAARLAPAGVLIDVGSTTTDIVPFRDGAPCPAGRTDTARLATGELVYTGLLRTPPAAIADQVPLRGGWCRLSPEHFAVTADVYRVLGRIQGEACLLPMPDGRGVTIAECVARLARVLCADPADLGRDAIRSVAVYLEDRQIDLIARALHQVLSEAPGTAAGEALIGGVGAFLAAASAARCGLRATRLADRLAGVVEDAGPLHEGVAEARTARDGASSVRWDHAAPSAALAILLAEEAGAIDPTPSPARASECAAAARDLWRRRGMT